MLFLKMKSQVMNRPVITVGILITVSFNLINVLGANEDFSCPQSCVCAKASVRVQPPFLRWVKLKCGGGDVKLSTTEEIEFGNLANFSDIITLDLSGNNLTIITSKAFTLPSLQKLDLNNNYISKIEDGAFKSLPNLKRLDLSNNRLRRVNRNMFDNLHNLERLRLSQNFISQIKEGTFDELASLKQIDLTNNPLVCDCGLWWILEWARNTSVKFSPLPKCSAPPLLRGQPLRKLKGGSQCAWPQSEFDSSALELNPNHNQVVFEGDTLHLQCRALTAEVDADDTVSWVWADRDPAEVFHQTIQVQNKHIRDNGFIESILVINQLQTNHSGQWRCQFYSDDGNHTTSISVIVINNQTIYCPIEVTKDNKGVYTWPKTVAGHLVELPCAVETTQAQASYMCARGGHWEQLFTDNCPFASETTRILEQFSKMNLNSSEGSVIESLRRFHNFTCDETRQLRDKVDIAFIASTVDNYLSHVPRERELGDLLVEVVNSVMKQSQEVLTEAQRSFNACSRLVSAVETIAHFTPAFQAQKGNVAVQEFAITRQGFHGLTCTWYSHHGVISDFLCFVANETAFIGTKDKVVEASIQVPARLFEQLEVQGIPSSPSGEHLLVAMYSSGHLFPHFNKSKQVTSCVVGTKLIGMSVEQLSEPVYVMLRAPLSGSPRPAWWHPPSLSWRQDGCQLSDLLHGLLVFQCNRLGYFSLLQDTGHLPHNSILVPRSKSRLTHPAVYVGTFVGITCLLVTSLTYIVCYSSIQMSNKAKHSLSNTWLAISALCLVFSIGIYQTEDLVTCEVIGLLIHYLTLCSLLWMAVTINGMYKRMSKTESVPTGSEELSGEPVVVGQPLVGLYLVGWGIAGLVCGLSGAVNLPHYAGACHCSLGPGPGVSALLVPCVALCFYLLIRALMVRCATGSIDSNAQLSEGTQATDLELLDNTVPPERSSLHSVVTPSSQVEDLEHSPATQLKAFLIVLMLFVMVWVSATLTVLKPFKIAYEETVFSIAYAFFVINLGVFVVFFHCFARNDVRTGWFSVKPCFRSRNVSDSRAAPPPVVSSSDSLNSSSGLKSAAITLNSSPPQGVTKNASPGNMNLVLLHRRQYHSNNLVNSGNEAEVFYNPHQSGVARKFFKKQRRKQNNLGTRRSGDGGGSPSPFIGGAKVNNTNFHVEFPEEHPSSNPNILHGEAPLERLVIGAEGSQPILNNDGSFRLGYSTEDQVLSEGSVVDTDCGRGMSAKQSCGSSHIAVSDQSDGSHLYATIDPPSPFHKRRKHRPNPVGITIDSKTESVRVNLGNHDYSIPITSDDKSTDDSNDKKETCV